MSNDRLNAVIGFISLILSSVKHELQNLVSTYGVARNDFFSLRQSHSSFQFSVNNVGTKLFCTCYSARGVFGSGKDGDVSKSVI